ncbi:hypothetical protein GCM10010211_43700 [Streptomyces albospinus]|uniref:Uncharacterized protein n=1 Tax=Streptomyces albospinus TaxID=285515 RepID=A0ABQ2V9U4_9ACTN|nr:hypothetical protein GCM10010211_43700 [Streptomyces albospinus]
MCESCIPPSHTGLTAVADRNVSRAARVHAATYADGTNSFDTVRTGWQAAHMTYGIESHFTR